jgi:hypothetical protein
MIFILWKQGPFTKTFQASPADISRRTLFSENEKHCFKNEWILGKSQKKGDFFQILWHSENIATLDLWNFFQAFSVPILKNDLFKIVCILFIDTKRPILYLVFLS